VWPTSFPIISPIRRAAWMPTGRRPISAMSKSKFLEMVEQGRMPQPVRIEPEMPRWDRLELDTAFDDLREKRKSRLERDREKLHERLK
jgi:predicted DNA-binding transcriptional regulator AlpA